MNEINFSIELNKALSEHKNQPLIADSVQRMSGQDILREIRILKAHLDACSEPGDPVLISFPNSCAGALAILASLVLKRIPVILSPQDFGSAPAVWIARSGPSLILSDREHDTQAIGNVPQLVLKPDFSLTTNLRTRALRSTSRGRAIPEGTALVLFTSGTTGEPKGICVPAQGLFETSQFLIRRFELDENAISPIVLPICHSMGLNTQFLPTLFAGGLSYFSDIHLELPKLFRTILESRSTHVALISELLLSCAKEKQKRNLPAASCVSHLQLAGGLITQSHLELAKELFPHAIIHKGYGLTEAIRVSMIDNRDENFLSASVGTPLPFNEVEIRSEGTTLKLSDAVGEIWIKGSNVLKGILGREAPELDRNWLATGDLGYWNEQRQLCIVGRDDGLFKFNGNRISGAEIEQAALEVNSEFKNAKCLLVPDGREGRQKIALFVEVQNLAATESLCLALNARLRQLSQPLKQVFFMTKFPTTSNGKVSLSRLRELHAGIDEAAFQLKMNSPLQFYGLKTDRTADT